MTKQPLIILFCCVITSIIVVSVVHAFAKGNVDGQWTCIEPDNTACGSATNDCWASGPEGGSINYDAVARENTYTWFYEQSWYDLGRLYTDWNQVRYGGLTEGGIEFPEMSGFGFDGVNIDNEPLTPDLAVPFLLGKFCHFNNPIQTNDEMEWVDLDIRVDGVECDTSAEDTTPHPDGVLNIAYRFTLDETSNSPEGIDCWTGHAFCPYTLGADTYCPYETGVNSLGCADRVGISALPLSDSFTCYYDGAARNFTISILGLIPLMNPGDTCPADPAGDYSHALISQEETYNCACLYGSFTELGVTSVELISFTAAVSQGGILLEWETATELDTLGFNLLRSATRDGEKKKINQELIPSNLPPGSLLGASYSYLDTGEDFNQAQFPGEMDVYYWLEEMDSFGRSELHGPVTVTNVEN